MFDPYPWGGRETTTDESGHYQFDDIESGFYEVDVHPGCDGNRQMDVWVQDETVVDLPLSTFVDSSGYYCELEDNAPWVSGTTLLPKPEYPDDDYPYPLPFPFFGRTYTEFGQLGPFAAYFRDAEGYPEGDIEFLDGVPAPDDEDEDEGAQPDLYVATVGTAPHRQFVVEARNISVLDHPDIKYSDEMIFGEDGTFRVLLRTPPGLSDADFPKIWYYDPVTWGEIDYFEDGRGYPLGKSVVVHPPAAS